MNGRTVQLDVDHVRNLLVTARRNGTVDGWCELALEWVEKASAGAADLTAQRDQLRADRSRLLAWVNDLQSGMYINCVYCGHRYGPSDGHAATLVDDGPPTTQDALQAHIERCPEHPMSKLQDRVNELEALYAARVTMDRILDEPATSELLRDLNDLMAKHGLK